ncbi:MAG: hypothetical protein CEE38_15960 [Planctomycetes bacterium B3_Pla]|nr:MAG: hypothetical protein CEE38_15960 [Planctomycetes bacterium B3_Pla]
MKIKRAILMLTVIALLVAIPVLAKPPGSLGPPTLESIVVTTATIDEVDDVDVYFLDWTDVEGADKYSVDIEATATYDTGEVDEDEVPIMATVEVSASFGTSDRLDGGDMSDSDLNIPVSDVEALLAELDAALAAALAAAELDPETEATVEVTAKVKALDPSVKPTKRQNNPFSNSLPLP